MRVEPPRGPAGQQSWDDVAMTYALDRAPSPYEVLPPVPSFTLTSQDIQDGERMPDRYVRRGANRSPQFRTIIRAVN